MDSGEDVVDPGLQSERTSLAWRRTALSCCVVGGLLLHAGDAFALRLGQAAVICILIFATFLYRIGSTRYRCVVAAIRTGRPITNPNRLKVIALGTIVLQILAIAVCLGAHFAHR